MKMYNMYMCVIATNLSLALLGGGGASKSVEYSTAEVQSTSHITSHTVSHNSNMMLHDLTHIVTQSFYNVT